MVLQSQIKNKEIIMKKILFGLMTCLAVSFACVSCGDDDNSGAPVSNTPAANVQGEYEGTMVLSDATTGVVSGEYPVKVSVEPVEGNAYAINVKQGAFSDSEAVTIIMNIPPSSGIYSIYNKDAVQSPVESAVEGTINSGVINYSYSKVVQIKVGGRPKKVTTNFVFTGKVVNPAEE